MDGITAIPGLYALGFRLLRKRDSHFIGGVGSAHDEELLIRDMDLDMITQVRQTWQFYRDRRPEAYDDPVRP